jgi:hypothetical protein
MALEEIAAETSTDSELQAVIKAVQTGRWYEKNMIQTASMLQLIIN